MYSSKYSKALTVVLVIVIVLIIGLLIFWGVDTFKKYSIDGEADEGIEAFKNQIANNNNSNSNSNINKNVIMINPYENSFISSENNISGNNINDQVSNDSSNNSNSSGLKYKGYDMVGYIEIPKTKIKYPILAEMNKKTLETSVVIMAGVGLNEVGNTVIAGHNFRNGLFFSDNAKLNEGDQIYITDTNGNTVTYVIYKKYITTPEDAEFINRDTNGAREISLATCNDNSQKRIIILAKEE